MEKKIEVPFGEYKIVAERGADSNYNEIFIFLEDKSGMCVQDLAIVGQKYHYNKNLDVVQDESILVRVFADEYNEDYTHKFEIGVYKEEDEDESED